MALLVELHQGMSLAEGRTCLLPQLSYYARAPQALTGMLLSASSLAQG